MKYKYWLLWVVLCNGVVAKAQLIYYKDRIVSPYVLDDTKAKARRDRVIKQANALNSLPMQADEESATQLEINLAAVSQFMLRTPQSDSGVRRLMNNYDQLSTGTKRALLEVVYGLYPDEFVTEVKTIMQHSTHPKLFAMAAAFLYRAQPSEDHKRMILQKAATISGDDDQLLMLQQLKNFIESFNEPVQLPEMDSLLNWQQQHKFKVVYSFQRRNRNYPGLAIVQNADGSFARNDSGRLRTFQQLARSASNLPWFVTNGSTPQGLYTITGTAVSKNVFIGPTPNLQLAMMNEVNGPKFTHYFPMVFNAPPEKIYRSYFPQNWQHWSGLMEAYNAGKIGRSEIIAHGSTIDPEWYHGTSFYPLTPTMGCLCGREIWNKQNGRIRFSDQLDLVNAFIETPGTEGYLMVINIDDEPMPVTVQEVEKLIKKR